MIVTNKDKIEKLNSIEEQTNSKLLNYYKANLAITQYLINYYYKKGKE